MAKDKSGMRKSQQNKVKTDAIRSDRKWVNKFNGKGGGRWR